MWIVEIIISSALMPRGMDEITEEAHRRGERREGKDAV